MTHRSSSAHRAGPDRTVAVLIARRLRSRYAKASAIQGCKPRWHDRRRADVRPGPTCRRCSRRQPGTRGTFANNELLRCSDTNGDQRPISRPRLDAARSSAFVDQRCSTSCRPAKGGDQNLIVAATRRAIALQAVVTEYTQAGARLSLRSRWSGRSPRALWTRRARWPRIALGAGRSRSPRIALRSLAAAAHRDC
jgi:hypothetical protein